MTTTKGHRRCEAIDNPFAVRSYSECAEEFTKRTGQRMSTAGACVIAQRAEAKLFRRLRASLGAQYGNREAMVASEKYGGLTVLNPKGQRHFNGVVRCHQDVLEAPLHWRKPRRVFVNSMSDLFHKDVPFEFIDKVFAVMALCPQHTFQVLTKRPERMAEYASRTPTRPSAANARRRQRSTG
jgi:hypothetical protein